MASENKHVKGTANEPQKGNRKKKRTRQGEYVEDPLA